ncbi:MAG: hypothetical protein AB7S83_06450 [Candidatus Methanomethylophilaceae archaeon]|jgi:hypothetical protein
MSFIDNPKNFGLAAVVIGIVSILAGILAIVNGALADPMAIGLIVASIGTILYGVLILGIGLPIYRGEDTSALSILGKFVNFVGLATIVVGIFTGAGLMVDDSIASGAVEIVIALIFGLILMWIAKKITDNVTDTFDKIIWILLVIVFLVLTIVSLIGIITPFLTDMAAIDMVVTAVLSLCQFILYAFLLVAVLSNDVKSRMGM